MLSVLMSRALSRSLRIGVALVVATILLFAIAQQARVVGTWWLELSRYLPFPALLGPAAVALVVSRWLGRWWMAASAVALVAVLTLVMGFEWNRPDTEGVPLRLMTYNIKAYRAEGIPGGFAALAKEVALQNPDVLVMQDAQPISRARPPISTLPHTFLAGQYAVASRYPLRSCALRRTGSPDDEISYVHCVLEVDGSDVDLVTVHFESPRTGLNAARREGLGGVDEWKQNFEVRLGQARALARELLELRRPLIVAGDLNAPETSPVIRTLLGSGLRDAYSSAGRGYGYTHGHALRLGFSFLRIDHVLLNSEIGVSRCFVGNSEASEHRPVIADLLLRRPGIPLTRGGEAMSDRNMLAPNQGVVHRLGT
jgi:endonuclease/exonuclease/phosphatase (EEP) superfamily protein YafD